MRESFVPLSYTNSAKTIKKKNKSIGLIQEHVSEQLNWICASNDKIIF